MLHKTRGIVFRFTKYGETSIIVNIFTEQFGMQSYIVNGVRSNSKNSRIALYQPLTLLDMVVYHREHANIMRIKELKCLYPYQQIPMDIKKSTMAMFIGEVVNKTIKEESHAQELCDFLIQSMVQLDQLARIENFHIVFLIKLSRYLGFGAYSKNEIIGGRMASLEAEALLDKFVEANYETEISLSLELRREILDVLLSFFTDHIPIGEMKSVQVLREIMT
jgi:DNA repair protein RecO (recombination protein O)